MDADLAFPAFRLTFEASPTLSRETLLARRNWLSAIPKWDHLQLPGSVHYWDVAGGFPLGEASWDKVYWAHV